MNVAAVHRAGASGFRNPAARRRALAWARQGRRAAHRIIPVLAPYPRGPDGHGTHQYGALAFGATRLSIIDLAAPAGPIFNEDGRIGIVLNGEIYNHKQLRSQLEKLGHIFCTQTDTEVIVHAYEEWGIDALKQLRGRFAFGLWDANQECLLLARDRLGYVPLYYAETDTGLLFASETKALLEYPGLPRRVNGRRP